MPTVPTTSSTHTPTRLTHQAEFQGSCQELNYWEKKLRGEAESLTSLKYFKPDFMSLMKPYPIFSSAGSSPYETTKAAVQALFLSGRYRTERLCRHWSSNKGGHCLLHSCAEHRILEDKEHILLHCASLSHTRERLVSFILNYSALVPEIGSLLFTYLNPNNPHYCQFLLDCSVIPEVISFVQSQGSN